MGAEVRKVDIRLPGNDCLKPHDAGPLNQLADKAEADQLVVDKEVSLCGQRTAPAPPTALHKYAAVPRRARI